MKITYTDAASAQRALEANGTLIGGAYMVGCVLAPQEGESAVDAMSDAMDVDPVTPPRSRMTRYANNTPPPTNSITAHQKTPGLLATPQRRAVTNNLNGSVAGRKIEILTSDAIYKSHSPVHDRTPSWLSGWMGLAEDPKAQAAAAVTMTTPAAGINEGGTGTESHPGRPGWPTRIFRGLVDTIFGF